MNYGPDRCVFTQPITHYGVVGVLKVWSKVVKIIVCVMSIGAQGISLQNENAACFECSK